MVKLIPVVLVHAAPSSSNLNTTTVIPPLGLAYLAAALQKEGYQCIIVDAYALRSSIDDILHSIPVEPALVGFYLNSFNFTSVLDAVLRIRRERPCAHIVLGGPLPSAAPERVLRDIPCHALVRGEGEHAIVAMARNLSTGQPLINDEVSGGAYLSADGTVHMNPIHRIMNLDELDFPAYELLPPLSSYKSRSRKSPVGMILTSRGCAFQCIFCSRDVFQNKVTFRSSENVLAEIDFLVQHYGVRQIDFIDDNFALRRDRMMAILKGLIERDYGLALNMQTGIRTESLDDEVLETMKQAGVFKIGFGIESIDPHVLSRCKKQLDVEKLIERVAVAKKMGFLVYGFFIIGLPGETEESFQKTLQFAKKMDFDVANFMMATPFIGTELYDLVRNEGKFLIDTTRNIDYSFYSMEPFFELDGNTREVLTRRFKEAYQEFYTFNKKLRMLAQIRTWGEFRWLVSSALWTYATFFHNMVKRR